jgi:hypothetical protein
VVDEGVTDQAHSLRAKRMHHQAMAIRLRPTLGPR